MRYLILFALLLLAAPSVEAQSILNITPGWSRDSAMAVLAGRYRVADTLLECEGTEQVIRMAPVTLGDYDGWFELRSDNGGRVVSITWWRAPWNAFGNGDERWATFTGWQQWPTPTTKDFVEITDTLQELFRNWQPLVVYNPSTTVKAWTNSTESLTAEWDERRILVVRELDQRCHCCPNR